jgi:hypothetical protein
MDRVTKKDIYAAFARAFPADMRAENVGGSGDGYDNRHNIGKHALDYAPVYGGWKVVAYAGGSSGMGSAHSTPFGDRRRAGKEMLDWLEGVAVGREVERNAANV